MKTFLVILACIVTIPSWTQVHSVRWTYQEDSQSELSHIIQLVNKKTGLELKTEDFVLQEDRPLATSRFQMWGQKAGNFPIQGQSIRIWTRLSNNQLIQMEARVSDTPPPDSVRKWGAQSLIASNEFLKLVRKAVSQSGEDSEIRDLNWKDEWSGGQLVRTVSVKARRGTHRLVISHSNRKVIESRYEPFQFADSQAFEVPAMVYPIWEEYENVPADLSGRVRKSLKYLSSQVREPGENPYLPLKNEMRYLESFFDPIKGLTEEGRKEGFWAMSYVKEQARKIFEQLPIKSNALTNGTVLEGAFATVNYHPSVAGLKGLGFDLKRSAQFRPNWVVLDPETEMMEMIPDSGFLGRPLRSAQEAMERVARRLPDHSVVEYINDGFDEVQVYWAVTQLFDSLRPMGFTDPELSTRPFHAYLYDTDISMKDNAYYTDDTINFTTYTTQTHNMARDNTTIWHELGHGVMDRLMGDYLNLADTGGLSEGIADFVADLVMVDVMQGKEFTGSDKLRIRNRTGFYLTNESHDDGEAYGGTLHDVLSLAMKKEGLKGLRKVTDLTLESMRLTRNHPGLTATDWFSHMLFADELGNAPLRQPGELRDVILNALKGRNFNLDGKAVADFSLKTEEQEITATSLGSRARPIPVRLAAEEVQEFPLKVALKSSDSYAFKYPVTIKVQLQKGPIQGAIRWKNESAEPKEYILKSEEDIAWIPLAVHGTCDEVNRPDGSCVDYAYVQIWNAGEKEQPQAKKRFYLRVVPQK